MIVLGTTQIALLAPLVALSVAFDVFCRRIPNAISVAVFLTGAAASWSVGGLSGLASALGAAVVVGGVLVLAWRMRALGGGDLKLGVACAAWVGTDQLVEFTVASAVLGGIAAVLCFGASNRTVRREVIANLKLAAVRAMPAVPIAQGNGRVSVPYGAAMAIAALWTLCGG